MPQGRLAQVLRGLTQGGDERLLVGPSSMDDAGVVLLGRGEGLSADRALALVQTVDFFPPVVDDPYSYGRIAAANALSDVYAMGARPLSALTLASFPAEFDEEWMAEILRGGFETIAAAGAVVAGGHTVEGEVQFGFAVTGVVAPDRVVSNAGARAGDACYLTKPLGMGATTTAAKLRKVDEARVARAVEHMTTLNDRAAEAMQAAGAHACTDVTGFGLVGHGRNVAAASGVTLEIDVASVPLFEGALELARANVLSGGAARGRQGLADEVRIADGLERARVDLCFDAETSGGLLIAVDGEDAAALERELAARRVPVHRVGAFVPDAGVAVALR